MPESSETDVRHSPTSPPLPTEPRIPPPATTVSFLPDRTTTAGCDSLLTDNARSRIPCVVAQGKCHGLTAQGGVDPVVGTTMMWGEPHKGGPDGSTRETPVHRRVQGRGGWPGADKRQEHPGGQSGPRPDRERGQGLGGAGRDAGQQARRFDNS